MTISFPYTLTSSLGGLQFPKYDLQGVPPGAHTEQYLSSSDWNTTQQAIVETALGITSGSLFGFQRSASSPTGSAGPNGNFADFIWLSSSAQLMLHTRDGNDHFLSGSGGGGGLGYVPSLSASYTAATSISGNVIPMSNANGPLGVSRLDANTGVLFYVKSGSVTFLQVSDDGTSVNVSSSLTASNRVLFRGDTDANAVGPVTIKAVGTETTIGTAITLDSTANGGGHIHSFISTGPGAGPGAGAFAVFDGTAGKYLFKIDTSQNFLPGLNLTYGMGNSSWSWASVWAQHFVGNALAAPSGTLGSGAGTGASYTISGSDSAHLLSVSVGTATVAGVPLLTGTFNVAFSSAPNGIQLAPANAAAAGLTGSYEVYVDSNAVFRAAGSSYVLMVGPAQLPPSTTYKWWVSVIG